MRFKPQGPLERKVETSLLSAGQYSFLFLITFRPARKKTNNGLTAGRSFLFLLYFQRPAVRTNLMNQPRQNKEK